MQSRVFLLALFTYPAHLPHPLTFPFPISTKKYHSRDIKGISKSARACKSILAARGHSSILKYPEGLDSARVCSSQSLTRPELSSSGVPRAGSCPTLFKKLAIGFSSRKANVDFGRGNEPRRAEYRNMSHCKFAKRVEILKDKLQVTSSC